MGIGVGLTGVIILRGIAMRKNCFVLLFVVLALGVYSPSAKAIGFVDVLYDVELDVTFGGGASPVASPMSGFMTIRYEHAGTGFSGTTIAPGAAQMMGLSATGPVVLYVGGILSMTGTAWLTIGPGTVGTWGSIPFPASYTSITKTSGLNLPGFSGLLTADANCHNIGAVVTTMGTGVTFTGGTACTGFAGMPPTLNPHTLPVSFTNKALKGYGNFNTAGPPTTLSFLRLQTVSATTASAPFSVQIASTLIGIGIPMELNSIVGVEISRTPEPNTALLLGGGIIGLAGFAGWRKRA